MSTLPLDIPRQAKSLIETGKTSAKIDAFLDTWDWIRRIPRPYRRDAILKRERALELLSKRAEQVIGSMAAFRLTKPFAVFAQPTLSWSSSPLCDWMSLRCQKHRLPPLPPLKRFHA